MSNLSDEMNANALEAMKLTRKYFVVELDFSAESLKQLDRLFADVKFAISGGRSPENIDLLTRVWGSYVGEVIRRNVDGEWTAIRGECGHPSLVIHETKLFPHDVVNKRLLDGTHQRMWDYLEDARRSS